MTSFGSEEPAALAAMGFERSYRMCLVLEPTGVVRAVSDVAGVTGWDPAVFVGRSIAEIAVGGRRGRERQAVWEQRLRAAHEQPAPIHYLDLAPDRPSGEPTVDCTMIPVRGASGEMESIVLHVQDQSEVLEVQRRLGESEEQFRVLAETLPQMVWVTDPDGNGIYFSQRWVEFTGRPREALLERGLRDLIDPDDLPALAGPRLAQVPPDESVLQFRLRRRDGVYRWVEAQIRCVKDDAGQVVEWVGGTVDITDRRETADLAREHEAQLSTALAVSGLGRYAVYLREPRFDADRRYADIIGRDPQELMRQGGLDAFLEMVHTDDRAKVTEVLAQSLRQGTDYECEYRIWRASPTGPELRSVSVVGRVESDDDGPVRFLGVIEDVTDERGEDVVRMRSQKREVIGTLAGGIAHDFNNVISAILSNASVAEHELAAGDSPLTSLREIARGARRAGDMVQRLLAFSHDERLERRPFDLGAVTREACELIRPTLEPAAVIRTSIEPSMPPVLGDATQLHQVVMNLVANAGQALGVAPGRIDVRVDLADLVGPGTGTAASLPPGRYARLTVRDDGPGVPEELRERVFDPFFTTKPSGRGTGLGLAAAQSIVRNHGGTIAVDGEVGAGAAFVVHLPAARTVGVGGDGRGRPSHRRPVAAPVSLARVLFVDDEMPLVRLAERALPTHGCRATVFSDPLLALAAFEAEPDDFDCLVTDLSMPQLSGLELIERVRLVRPALPVVLSSGFLTADGRAEADAQGVDAIVPKPCSIDEVAEAVLRVVGRPGLKA